MLTSLLNLMGSTIFAHAATQRTYFRFRIAIHSVNCETSKRAKYLL